MGVSGSDREILIWYFIEDNFVEEPRENNEI